MKANDESRRPRIVVLDGHTLNPGDLDWSELAALGELTVYDRSGEKVVERAAGAPIVLTNKEMLDARRIEKLPDLRYIGVLATGMNVVDLEAAKRRGIVVTNVPGYAKHAVTEHVFALVLELAKLTGAHAQAVREGQWSKQEDFCFTVGPIVELAGKTMGIVGMGAIGGQVARVAGAMGMKVAAAHQRSMKEVSIPGVDIEWLALDELVERADVLTLHCPLTEATRGMMSAERMGRMKKSAFLINTGRGALVDEGALAEALREGRIAGAGLDVLSQEPPPADHPLVGAPRCVVTPHVAWASVEARRRVMAIAAANVREFLGKGRGNGGT